MRITVAPTPLKTRRKKNKKTLTELLVGHRSLVLWDKNILFLKGVANYQYCVWFKGEIKMQHNVSEGAKIKQNVNLFLYLTKKFQYPTTPQQDLVLNKYTNGRGG